MSTLPGALRSQKHRHPSETEFSQRSSFPQALKEALLFQFLEKAASINCSGLRFATRESDSAIWSKTVFKASARVSDLRDVLQDIEIVQIVNEGSVVVP